MHFFEPVSKSETFRHKSFIFMGVNCSVPLKSKFEEGAQISQFFLCECANVDKLQCSSSLVISVELKLLQSEEIFVPFIRVLINLQRVDITFWNVHDDNDKLYKFFKGCNRIVEYCIFLDFPTYPPSPPSF